MSTSPTTRARWSDDERIAVVAAFYDPQNTTVEDFFSAVEKKLGTPYRRRTMKAYVTFLNEYLNTHDKGADRSGMYQTLCDANQRELAAQKVAEALATYKTAVASLTAEMDRILGDSTLTSLDISACRVKALDALYVLQNDVYKTRGVDPVEVSNLYVDTKNYVESRMRGAILAIPATPLAVPATPLAEILAEVDVVPRVPPGRAPQRVAFRDPLAPPDAADADPSTTGVPGLPTLTQALSDYSAKYALAASMVAPVRGAGPSVTAEPVTKVVVPNPMAVVPKHYPALPAKPKLTADELAQVFGIHRNRVVDAFAYGFVPTLDGIHITYHTARRLHDVMSEGHSFSEACRQVNPSSSGILPMEALIEKEDPPVHEEQSPVVVPNTEAGKVGLQLECWAAVGEPLNPRSVDKIEGRLKGDLKVLFAGHLYPAEDLMSAEEPTVAPDDPLTRELPISTLDLTSKTPATDPDYIVPAPEVPSGAFEEYTLEAVRDGILTTAQAVDILALTDTRKAVWALSLLASGKITVAQCDRLLHAKSA
jgi:hypothetical protein